VTKRITSCTTVCTVPVGPIELCHGRVTFPLSIARLQKGLGNGKKINRKFGKVLLRYLLILGFAIQRSKNQKIKKRKGSTTFAQWTNLISEWPDKCYP
jgi:hypothetical protein